MPLSLRIHGESEVGRDVNLTVRAGGMVVVSQAVGSAFDVDGTIPAAALGSGENVITIETDGSFVPAEIRWRTQDQRRLGLKILKFSLGPAS
jgi:hypothetical protein